MNAGCADNSIFTTRWKYQVPLSNFLCGTAQISGNVDRASGAKEILNKCIMHYRLPWDIQDHANNIERTTDRVATGFKRKGKRG